MFIDTHAHLFYKNFEGELDEVIERASAAMVDFIIVPATDIKTAKETIAIAEKYNMVYGAVGIHPHDSKDWNDSFLDELKELASHPKIIAIGEIGLDYYYDFSPKEKQIEAFRRQIELAISLNLPVVVHNRDSDKDMMNIISDYKGTGLKAQFHCFNGTVEDARELIKMHHNISFTGNITFKKLDSLREIVKNIPLDHLMLETDSPFMTPIPFRGKRNEPAYVKYVAEQAASIHNISVEEIGKITSFNAFKFFGIGSEKNTTFTYKIYNNLYINVTNRCNAGCVFCDRKGAATVYNYNLKMSKTEEPPADVYIEEIGNPKDYDEIVFCGFGEPTIRWNVVKEIAGYVKKNGGSTRLNTNGHGNYINKKDITPELKGLIDTVSISLNAVEAKQYSEIMRVDEKLFYEMINFAKEAKKYADKVVLSVVDIDEVDHQKAKKLIEEEIGAEFRIRPLF
jgi:TatD DNase family protein